MSESARFKKDNLDAADWLAALKGGDEAAKSSARMHLAEIFVRRGMPDEAIELLEVNVRLGNVDAQTIQFLVRIYSIAGRHDQATQAREYLSSRWPNASPTGFRASSQVDRESRSTKPPGDPSADRSGESVRAAARAAPSAAMLAIALCLALLLTSFAAIALAGGFGQSPVRFITESIASTVGSILAGTQASRSLPPEWETFQIDSASGAIRSNWIPVSLTGEETASDMAEALQSANISEKFRASILKQKISGRVIFILFDIDGSENINILTECIRGSRESFKADSMVKVYQNQGLTARHVATANYQGDTIDIIQASLFPGLDTYQAFSGSTLCTRTTTLTARAGNKGALEDFKTFISLLRLR